MKPKVCISFAGSSGLGGFPAYSPELAAQLQREFPAARITLIQDPGRRPAELADTDALFAVRFSPQDLQIARQLKWLHLASAGATHVLFPEMIDSDVIITNSRGLHGIPIAEHILGVMIMLARQLHVAYRYQLEGQWPRRKMFALYPSFSELHGRTAGIIGLGGIGLALAERAKALGMRVIATRRRVKAVPSCVDEVSGTDGLARLLQEADCVIIAAPLTPQTTGLIGEHELRLMKPTAHIINVGRGPIIQELALIQALKEGWIAGAGLDVTDPEPPQPDSELFRLPNVILTPHTSGLRSEYWKHATAVFKPNLARFLRGEALDNVVDKHGGY